MQAAEPSNRLMAGAQIKVIRVPENDFRVEVVDQIARQDTLDGSLRADRHENGRFHVAVRGMKYAGASAGDGTYSLELEWEHVFIVVTSSADWVVEPVSFT